MNIMACFLTGLRCVLQIYVAGLCLQDNSKLSFVEVFAGKAEATKAFRAKGMPSARLDILYMSCVDAGENPMDLLSNAGMAKLVFWQRL